MIFKFFIFLVIDQKLLYNFMIEGDNFLSEGIL